MNARTKLMSFGAYSKALELFDLVVADLALAGRYLRLKPWLPAGLPMTRIALCDEIIGILTASILKLRSQLASTK